MKGKKWIFSIYSRQEIYGTIYSISSHIFQYTQKMFHGKIKNYFRYH